MMDKSAPSSNFRMVSADELLTDCDLTREAQSYSLFVAICGTASSRSRAGRL